MQSIDYVKEDPVNTKDGAGSNLAEPLAEFQDAADALQSSDISRVIEIAEALLKTAPEVPYGYILLGIVSEIRNERSHATDMITKAHDLDPECREVAEVLSTLYYLSGKITDGLYFSKLAEILPPNQVFINAIPFSMRDWHAAMDGVQISRHYIEAMRAYEARQYNSCVEECVRELRLNSHHKLASELLGFALLGTNRVGRAISAFQTAIHLNPRSAKAIAGLGEALIKMGRSDDATACFTRAQKMDNIDPKILARCQRGLARIPGTAVGDLNTNAKAWYEHIKDDLPVRDKPFDTVEGAQLRVGIVSDMLYGSFIQPYFLSFIEQHDRSKVEIRLYSLCQIKDSATSRVQNATVSWRDIHDIDQFTLAETLRRENLDLIIDLCFDPEHQGIELFTVGAADKQVSWFGANEAASVLGMTHVLSDESTISVDQGYLSKGQACLQPSQGIITREPFFSFDSIPPSPVAENSFVMFGMRADPAAITATDAFMIADLLRSVPNSRLMLGLINRVDSEMQERLIGLFSLAGSISKIHFQELPEDHDSDKPQQDVCQDFFTDVDIFLSPSASIEFDDIALSLWMGAPAIVMQGTSRLGCLCASILHQADRGDWIADTPEQFIEIAKPLAIDTQSLIEMRASLRDEVTNSNLFNTTKVTTEIWKSLIGICEA